jgi:hypothetical protein
LDGRSKPHPGPKEAPRSDGRWSLKLDGESQEDPDGSPSEEPSDRAQGSQKVGGLNTSVLTHPFGRIKTDWICNPYFGPCPRPIAF